MTGDWPKCLRCGKSTVNVDRVAGPVHRVCLDEWWSQCGPLPAPITIACRNGPAVVIGAAGAVTATPDDDDPEFLRKRGVFT